MKKMKNTVEVGLWLGLLMAVMLLVAPSALADMPAKAAQVIIVSDDIREASTAVMRPGDSDNPDAGAAPSGGDSNPEGTAAGGDDGDLATTEGGKTNHGHGNNLDGVDSSNPGKSKEGEDESCNDRGQCWDDEGGDDGKKKKQHW